jgi:hypothetical protein
MKPEIFTDRSDFFHQAAEATAKRQNCSVDLVYACMSGLDGIWNSPDHLDSVSEVTAHFNDAARFAKRLHRAITLMTPSQRNELIVAGCVTTFQIEHLADVLAQDATSLSDWSRTRLRKGGKNLAAYDVAEMMRRLFRRQRRRITYGTEPTSDLPSTDFGRAVRAALGDFGVKSGWRSPARQAYDTQFSIGRRLALIGEACRKKNGASA